MAIFSNPLFCDLLSLCTQRFNCTIAVCVVLNQRPFKLGQQKLANEKSWPTFMTKITKIKKLLHGWLFTRPAMWIVKICFN